MLGRKRCRAIPAKVGHTNRLTPRQIDKPKTSYQYVENLAAPHPPAEENVCGDPCTHAQKTATMSPCSSRRYYRKYRKSFRVSLPHPHRTPPRDARIGATQKKKRIATRVVRFTSSAWLRASADWRCETSNARSRAHHLADPDIRTASELKTKQVYTRPQRQVAMVPELAGLG